MLGILCWNIFYINLRAPVEIIHASTASIFLNITSVSHPGEGFDIQWWRVKSLSPSWPPHRRDALCPSFPPSFYSVPVVYEPVKQNKKRRKWQHHLESALLKSERRGGGGWFPVDFNQLLYSTGATLSAAPRQQLSGCLNMPAQVPMGTKSQVSGSLWTVLMMDKAGLFIAYAALGLKTKKSSYFEAHFAAWRVRQKHLSMGWRWLKWRKMCDAMSVWVFNYKFEESVLWHWFWIQVVTAITVLSYSVTCSVYWRLHSHYQINARF